MMDMPDRVKVGYRTFRIEHWDDRAAMSAQRHGEISHIEGLIRVSTNCGRQKASNTMLHEILHAVWAEWNMAQGDSEERIVGTYADGLCAVWRDNPRVFQWIAEGLESV